MIFGVVGYLMLKVRYPAAPLLLGFVTRPLSALFLGITLVILLLSIRPLLRRMLSLRHPVSRS